MLDRLPLGLVLLLCVTIGLAPYRPPHVWEKLVMLAHGQLSRPIDIFDLVLHGTPWLLLLLKLGTMLRGSGAGPAAP